MTKRLYEGLFLLDANETARNWSELEGHIGTLLSKNSAEIRYSERWPDQKLAYEIKGVRKGTYYLTYFETGTDTVESIRREAELSEHILRLLVVQEDFLEDEMKRRREAASRRAQEEPPAAAAAEAPPSADASTEEPSASESSEPSGEAGDAAEEESGAAEEESGAAETDEEKSPEEAESGARD